MLLHSLDRYLATCAIGRFHLSHGLFGPTEIRILLIAGNGFIAVQPYVEIASRRFLLFDVAGVAAIAGMALMALAVSIRHTAMLHREETLR
jgi:hypothetical protein